ncbi:FAD binding domain-containing protein [Halobaculum magnesiiphilum]|uniref:Xanthine dehydrogenase family protein subunit M n=1 Tax=Halobaculum magnesiiphilum TaxID=1017351 RepID=A0A8T8WID0_9EURY|nr:xanthine dehydrogenase family protein subunit M [Halobaculum magnesiiphilum]QZP39484.1 xanthine dehydrogenase family protein subunit M [Halobaculum magnesiiphilum]
MFPDEFDYYAAESVPEALELLDEHSDAETELLAGGHSLLPAMKSGLSSPDVLIDVSGIDALHGVSVEGDTLSIGAMTTYSDLLDVDAAHEHAPAFTAAVEQVGDEQVRNRGTVGGNLAHADPASDLPGAALASDATVVAEGPDGEREIPIDDYFFGMYATALDPGELVTRVEIPSAADAAGAYAKKPSPSSGYAMVGVAALIETDGDTVTGARVGANGVLDHGVRLEPVEEALVGSTLDDDAVEVAASVATDEVDEMMMMSDLQASAEFRATLLEAYTKRALAAAADTATPRAAD